MTRASHPIVTVKRPELGIKRRTAGKRRVLALERIRDNDPEMVYANLFWWQTLGNFDLSVVNIEDPCVFGALPEDLDFRDFDAIVLSPRLTYDPIALLNLDQRSPCRLADYDGVKVLFRQDENFMTAAISEFIRGAGIDLFYSCVPTDQVAAAYGDLAEVCQIENVLTGYVDAKMRNETRPARDARVIDVFYRAYLGHLSGGDLIWEKYQIGAVAKERLTAPVIADISMDPADRIYGEQWTKRLSQTKAVLATESGSNVFDHDGSLFRRYVDIDQEVKLGSYSKCAVAYFGDVRPQLKGFEGNVRYAQVSPRHFEAASVGTAQIMFPGRYSDIFKPGRHYVELQRDFSNLDDCLDAVRDERRWTELTTCAFEEVIQNSQLSVENFVARVERDIEALLDRKTTASSRSKAKTPAADLQDSVARALYNTRRFYGTKSFRFWSIQAHAIKDLLEGGSTKTIYDIVKNVMVDAAEAGNAGVPFDAYQRRQLVIGLSKCAMEGDDADWRHYLETVTGPDVDDALGLRYQWYLLIALVEAGRDDLFDVLLARLLRYEGKDAAFDVEIRDGMVRAFGRSWSAKRDHVNKVLSTALLAREPNWQKNERLRLKLSTVQRACRITGTPMVKVKPALVARLGERLTKNIRRVLK